MKTPLISGLMDALLETTEIFDLYLLRSRIPLFIREFDNTNGPQCGLDKANNRWGCTACYRFPRGTEIGPRAERYLFGSINNIPGVKNLL